jgi:hypothetical protein
MNIDNSNWISNLDDQEITFIKNFILMSGSLKEIAKLYNVSYPTVRLRLDKIIQKIKLNEQNEKEPYISLIKKLALDDKINFDTAKVLINEYRKNIERMELNDK